MARMTDKSVRVKCGTCGHEHNNPHVPTMGEEAPCGNCGSTGKLAPVGGPVVALVPAEGGELK